MKYVPKPQGLHLDLQRACVAAGTLHVQRCEDCHSYQHPPRWRCATCRSDRSRFVPVAGRGTLHSAVTTHVTVDPAWSEEVPYVAAVVELDEGPRIIGELRGVRPDEVELGRRVHVHVEPKGEDFAYLVVELEASSGTPRPASPDGPVHP